MKITAAQKHLMWWALGVLTLESLGIVWINSLSHGWHPNYSISYYVGLETWSALVFALGNIAVTGFLGKYLFTVGKAWKMPRWYYWLVVLIGAMLIGLSLCPLGYFARKGLMMGDRIHEFCSRTMFCCMLLIALMFLSSKYAKGINRWGALVFIIYGLVAGAAYILDASWMAEGKIFAESAYLIGFMVLGLTLQTKGVINGKG